MGNSSSALQKLTELYERAAVVRYKNQLITVNGFTDQSEPLQPDVLRSVAELIADRLSGVTFDLIVGEEDKGAHLVAAVALAIWKPFTLARWYRYSVHSAHPSAVVVDINSEYFDGQLVLNGIEPGCRAVIIEDTISTGGTMSALVQAIKKRGASVAGAIAVVEKLNSPGVEEVAHKTGVHVQTLLRILVQESGVVVL